MPTPPDNDEQHKDVYAYAGLALYWAQCFEMSLTNALMLYERATNTKVTVGELESLEASLRQRTLGGLLNRAKTVIALDPKTTEKIDAALEARNFLAHHFFQDRATEFLTADGRATMIGELMEMQDTFAVADTLTMALCGALCEAIGLTKEHIDAEFNRMYLKATGANPALQGTLRLSAARP